VRLTIDVPFDTGLDGAERLADAMRAILTGPDGGFVRSIGFDAAARHIVVVLHVEVRSGLEADFVAAETRILDAVRPFDGSRRQRNSTPHDEADDAAPAASA
jgi:hypothetical protein